MRSACLPLPLVGQGDEGRSRGRSPGASEASPGRHTRAGQWQARSWLVLPKDRLQGGAFFLSELPLFQQSQKQLLPGAAEDPFDEVAEHIAGHVFVGAHGGIGEGALLVRLLEEFLFGEDPIVELAARVSTGITKEPKNSFPQWLAVRLSTTTRDPPRRYRYPIADAFPSHETRAGTVPNSRIGGP